MTDHGYGLRRDARQVCGQIPIGGMLWCAEDRSTERMEPT
jgi:hypothetical protein